MDYHFLLQGIFPTQGLNLGLPHCRQTLYCLSHQGSPVHSLGQVKISVLSEILILDLFPGSIYLKPVFEVGGGMEREEDKCLGLSDTEKIPRYKWGSPSVGHATHPRC